VLKDAARLEKFRAVKLPTEWCGAKSGSVGAIQDDKGTLITWTRPAAERSFPSLSALTWRAVEYAEDIVAYQPNAADAGRSLQCDRKDPGMAKMRAMWFESVVARSWQEERDIPARARRKCASASGVRRLYSDVVTVPGLFPIVQYPRVQGHE